MADVPRDQRCPSASPTRCHVRHGVMATPPPPQFHRPGGALPQGVPQVTNPSPLTGLRWLAGAAWVFSEP
jgi:hypothetical protein